jgi:hypothetical protein
VNFSDLRPKKRQSWQGLITDLAASLLIFSMPIQSHDSSTHSNGYGHPKTTLVRSLWIAGKTTSSTVGNQETVLELDKDYNFQRCHIAESIR